VGMCRERGEREGGEERVFTEKENVKPEKDPTWTTEKKEAHGK